MTQTIKPIILLLIGLLLSGTSCNNDNTKRYKPKSVLKDNFSWESRFDSDITPCYEDFDAIHFRGITPVDTNVMKANPILSDISFCSLSSYRAYFEIDSLHRVLTTIKYDAKDSATYYPIIFEKKLGIWHAEVKVPKIKFEWTMRYLVNEGQNMYTIYHYRPRYPSDDESCELWFSTDSSIVAINNIETALLIEKSPDEAYRVCQKLMTERKSYFTLKYIKEEQNTSRIEGTIKKEIDNDSIQTPFNSTLKYPSIGFFQGLGEFLPPSTKTFLFKEE